MEINRCPNCSGKLELSTSKTKMTCPFCGSEFTVDEATKATISEGFAEKDWFIYDWDYGKIKANSQLYTCVSSFIRAINDFGSASKIEEYMKNYLMKYDEISAPGIREDKMRGIRARIAGYLQPDERVILYDDNGLFIHGKTGTVITDKRTLLVEKKKVTNIPHSGIPTFCSNTRSDCPASSSANSMPTASAYSIPISIFREQPLHSSAH